MESKAEVLRRWKRVFLLIASIYVLGIGCAFGWFVYQNSINKRWYYHVEFLILKLAPRRPADVTPAQWAQCLHHTWNLHVNYGPAAYFPKDQRAPFVVEFESHLRGPVDLGTIDWIWDEYARRNPRARRYMHYRPTTPEMLESAEELNMGEPLDWWIGEFERREQDSK